MTKPPDVAAVKKNKPLVYIGGVVLTLWLINYGLVQIGQAPLVYCIGRNAAPAFEGYIQMVGLVLIGYFAFQVWKRGVFGAIWAGFLVTVVLGLPVFLTTLWGLGVEGRCG